MANWGGAAGGAASGAAAGAVLGPWGAAAGGVIGGLAGLFSGDAKSAKDEAARKQQLYQQAAQAGGNAQAGFNAWQAYNQQGAGALAALQRQAHGQDSVSSEQLRQSLQQNLAAQRSLAAGASPQNAAMAARTAAIQSGRLGAGLAGQQALAGLQERNQAQQQYGQLLGQLSGQAGQVGLGSQNAALTGYGASNAGSPAPSWIQQWGPAITGALSAYAQTKSAQTRSAAGGGSAAGGVGGTTFNGGDDLMPLSMSDERAKKDLRDGDDAAKQATEGLKALLFAYRDPRDGQGTQLGTTAQNLERVGLGQAVVNTPAGKMIDAGKLSGANTAMIAAMGRRVQALEAQQQPDAAAAAAAAEVYRRKIAAQYAQQLAAGPLAARSAAAAAGVAQPDPTARYWYMPDRGSGGSPSGDAGGQ